jgi:hypothetical protein
MERSVLIDRRRSPRRQPEDVEPLCRARLRTGRELAVVDISPVGALVEGVTRLLPNTHLDLHVVTRAGRVLVRCRVVRAMVCHLEADLIRYRVALAFERNVDTSPGYGIPSPILDVVAVAGMPYPAEEPAAATASTLRRSA